MDMFIGWSTVAYLVKLLLHIREATSNDLLFHGVTGSCLLSRGIHERDERVCPASENAVFWEGAIIAVEPDFWLPVLDPAAWNEVAVSRSAPGKMWVEIGGNVLVALLIYEPPLLIRERADHPTDVDQIKAFSIHPRLEHIIDLECAIRRHPGVGNWEKIHASNVGRWVAVSDVDGPAWH